jgi:pimeloyl-ACP methyl ester carboxylesterase
MMRALDRFTIAAGGLVDRAVVRVMRTQMARSRLRRPPSDARALLEDLAARYGAERHFADPDTFFRPPPLPQVRATHRGDRPGGALVDLAWTSSFRPFLPEYEAEHAEHVENLSGHARWYRSARPRPVVICLHGWGGGAFAFEARAFPVGYYQRLGLDPILFTLPFHGRRTPAGQRAGQAFPSPHVVRTNESFAQAIHDLRALGRWLREQDVPQIGVTGMSLGGYTTALLAALEPELAFAAPIIPAVSMSSLMWRHGENSPARKRAVAAGASEALLAAAFRVHAPLHRPCLVPKHRRIIIAAHGDRITPPDQAEALWRHWERPPLHWFPGGHLAQVGRADAFRAFGRFVRELRAHDRW